MVHLEPLCSCFEIILHHFREIFWNLIKSDNELVIEIRENGRFIKITQRQIHGIKNHTIWISIHGEIKERNGEKFPKIGSQNYQN